ncbi:MAG TPA: VWA domain-containing protein [Polyangia bacterium]|nr:VWA domain-containing protein [Polyangia bacterium]
MAEPPKGEPRKGERPRHKRDLLGVLAPYLLTLAIALPFAVYYFVQLRGPDIHWRNKWALLLLAAVPLGAWAGFYLERHRAGTMAFSRTHDLIATQQGAFGYLMQVPRAFLLVGIGLIAVALARPQRLSVDPAEVEGIDIVIALDVSNSMNETDMVPNRIGAAKKVIERFIERNATDRIGLVIFGKEAFTQCPLTLDTRAVVGLLKDVRIGLVDGQGTAIGNALGTAINRLRKSTAKSKVVVLVTDGDDNASKLDPRKAAKFAQTFGIKVFTILIGRDSLAAEAPPGQDRFGNLIRPQPRYPVNPKLLEEIAETTGGMPFLATDNEALEKRFQAILEDLDRSKLKAQTPHYAELYPMLIAPALIMVLLEILLSLTRFRRFP